MTSAARRSAEAPVWTVTKLVPGGSGFGRLPDGRAAFVAGALPGERIVPLTVEEKRGYVVVTEHRRVESSPLRVEPPCPEAERCGGCDWMHLEGAAQADAKGRILAEALRRIGGFREIGDQVTVIRAGETLRYRSRLRVHVGRDGRIGLFGRRSKALVEAPGCLVSRPEVEAVLPVLREMGRERPGALAELSEVEIRHAPAGVPVSLTFHKRRKGPLTADAEALLVELRGRGFAVALSGQVAGQAEQRYPLPFGLELHADAGVFTQVNWAVNEELVRAVVEGAHLRKIVSFCELYSGAGNFALPLMRAGLKGVAVERDRRAVRCARRAARAAGLPEGAFLAGDAAKWGQRLARQRRSFGLVLLDPPRSGAAEVLPAVIGLAPPYVAVCACDPATLARDLGWLAARGYALEEVTGFDMFPQTHHVEALAWMGRRESPGDRAGARRASTGGSDATTHGP